MKFAQIVNDPKIMRGKPTIKWTRITVELILQELANGHDVEYLLENYPSLTNKTIHEALQFAAYYLHHDELVYA